MVVKWSMQHTTRVYYDTKYTLTFFLRNMAHLISRTNINPLKLINYSITNKIHFTKTNNKCMRSNV